MKFLNTLQQASRASLPPAGLPPAPRMALHRQLSRSIISFPVLNKMNISRGSGLQAATRLIAAWRPLPHFKIGNGIICILLACLITPAAHATRLGRLFFTPEQRIQLDYDYARTASVEGNSSSVLTVNGIVQKHGGARTAWINGVPQKAGNSDERSPEALPVAVPGKSRPVKIKVGQKILLDQPAQPNLPTPDN